MTSASDFPRSIAEPVGVAQPVPEHVRTHLEATARRLPTRERSAFQMLLRRGVIWPTSGVDRGTVRRLQGKGLAQLVGLDRGLWVGELSDRWGTPWAAVELPAVPAAAPATAQDAAAMELAVRRQARFDAGRHNGDHGYDYTFVLDESGAALGLRYRSTLGGHGWVTVSGHLSPGNVQSGQEAEAQLRAAHTAAAVAADVVQAARRVHPTAHLFRPVPAAPPADGTGEVVGWTFRILAPARRTGWIAADRSVWRGLFTDEGPAGASLRRRYELGGRAAEAEQLARQAPPLPVLDRERAETIAGEAHGQAHDLLPCQPGGPEGPVFGYTYRAPAGYGWVTAYGSNAPHLETAREDAEQMVVLALAQDRRDGRTGAEPARALLVDCGRLNLGSARAAARQQHRRSCLFERTYDEHDVLLGWTHAVLGQHPGRGGVQYGWIAENSRTGQLTKTREDARCALAQAWVTDQVAPGR
jgi:hypothetical protein